jgi:hypothetical protein
MKWTRIILLILTIASLIAGRLLFPEEEIDERPYLQEVAPGVAFSQKGGIPPHYESASGISAFNSYDIVPSIRGYAGPIKLLIAINDKGIITGIKVLEHKETENYVRYMLSHKYLSGFLGKSVNDPFEVGRDVDAISRATISVNALVRTIRESSRRVAEGVYGIKVKETPGEVRGGMGWVLYLVLFLSALTLYYITRRTEGLSRARDVILLLSIIITGVYLSTPFSILHVFNLIMWRLSSSTLWYVIVISSLLSIIIAGRLYCGWLCPFGAICEFIGRASSGKWQISGEVDERWRRLKYLLLGMIIVLVLTTRHIEYGNFETYIVLFSLHGSVLTWILVGLMLIINLRVERFWCRYMCPVGALTGLLSRRDSGYVSRGDCPMGNRADPHISECIRCNRCYKGVSDRLSQR